MSLTQEQKQDINGKMDWEGVEYYMCNYAHSDAEKFNCEELKVLADKWCSLDEETEKWISDNGIDDCWDEEEE